MTDAEVRETRQPDVAEAGQKQLVTGDQLELLVVRSVYTEMIGRPVDQVYRALNTRLRAADVVLADERVWEYADSISDGTFELLR
jgi:hypothetical protein